MGTRNYKILTLVLAITAIGVLGLGQAPPLASLVEKKPPTGEEYGKSRTKNLTADHSKFEILKQPFISGPEVTRACLTCHTEKPHRPGVKANDHTDKVACQTCHIPAFARVNSTKMWWDWSQAGKKTEDGKVMVKKVNGRPVYHTKKGAFRWEKNVRPEYYWFNGVIKNVLLTDKIDPAKVVKLNFPEGSYEDPKARIYPFKVHRGKQPYDKVNKTMVVPKLFGPKGSGSYWTEYDWKKAITAGMAYAGLPFSGEYDYVETEYVFQTTHMVAPKEDALSCRECHSKAGRLANLNGFYMPGRDSHGALNVIGWAAVMIALLGGPIAWSGKDSNQEEEELNSGRCLHHGKH
ncbi:MAG: hypothetical protein JRJ03_11955 [Deltaproteobacteria bacterium]|nr:hypothetical protein [Deltaproteobacteria bacterium]